MVHFEKDRFLIEIHTGNSPLSNYLALQEEIAYVFSIMRPELLPEHGLYNLAMLLTSMQPDWDTALKMTK